MGRESMEKKFGERFDEERGIKILEKYGLTPEGIRERYKMSEEEINACIHFLGRIKDRFEKKIFPH